MRQEYLFIVSWCVVAVLFFSEPFLRGEPRRLDAPTRASSAFVTSQEARLRALIAQDKLSAQEALYYEVLNER